MSFDNLILQEATPEQYAITLSRQLKEWGKLNDSLELSLEQYTTREELLTSSSFGRRFRAWVLVPSSTPSTLNFLASCETYRRSSYVSTTSSPEAKRCVSYSIAGVIVPPESRGKGYSRKMLELLHLEFDPSTPASTASSSTIKEEGRSGEERRRSKGKETEFEILPSWQGGKDATFSFLFSDVGDFYSTFGNGWHVRPSYCTTWNVSDLPTETTALLASNSSIPVPITLENLEEITKQDSLYIQSSLTSSTLSNPQSQSQSQSISIAIEPTYENYYWAILRSNFYAQLLHRSIPDSLGIYIDRENFIMWIPDYPNECLKIGRLVCTTSTASTSTSISSSLDDDNLNNASILFKSLFQAAKSFNLLKIEGWNIDISILDQLPTAERGLTNERKDSLSCLSWYGTQSGEGEDADGGDRGRKVNWKFNEAYAWC